MWLGPGGWVPGESSIREMWERSLTGKAPEEPNTSSHKGYHPKGPCKGLPTRLLLETSKAPNATWSQFYCLRPLLPAASHRNWGKQALKIQVRQAGGERAWGKQGGAVLRLSEPSSWGGHTMTGGRLHPGPRRGLSPSCLKFPGSERNHLKLHGAEKLKRQKGCSDQHIPPACRQALPYKVLGVEKRL